MRIVLLGAPGSGKGTQGAKLAARFRIPHISTGDALRAAVVAGTELGRAARETMATGGLVADSLVVGIIEERLAQGDAQAGFILDGFPRNVSQAGTLDRLLQRHGHTIDVALHLHVADAELLHRLLRRGREQGRADDCEDVIRSRIEVYNAETRPLLDYYALRNKRSTVQGIGSIDEIFAAMLAALPERQDIGA